ncbi:MAG: putative DNA binding domain-containing protein [Burkholderiales bacterium]|nr:putative DNA binding domain-containing protein [Burkholderiales bacterium]
MATKLWVSDALQILTESLAAVTQEQNEPDWKTQLSNHKDRVAEHLMAFANHPNGGYLVFGVNDAGQCVGAHQHFGGIRRGDHPSCAQGANRLRPPLRPWPKNRSAHPSPPRSARSLRAWTCAARARSGHRVARAGRSSKA